MTQKPQLNPRCGFLVCEQSGGQPFDRRMITTFYQPIIGAQAVGVLLTLRDLRRPSPMLSSRQPITDLLSAVNLGINQLTEVFHKLEAVCLLKTFYINDKLGECFVYQLQATLTPTDFFNEDLLSVLLLDAIGEQKFTQLASRCRQFELDCANLTEVSADLIDTFHVGADSVDAPQEAIQRVRQSTRVPIASKPQFDFSTTKFDFSTLMTLLGSEGPTEDQIKAARELILTEHVLYGIDEPEMAKLVLQATDLHNRFSSAKFKRAVASSHPRLARSAQSNSHRQAKQQSKFKPAANSRQSQLTAACEQYSPNDFLALLKQESGGGYVTPGETWILKRLISDGKLPAPVINLLSWHLIANLGNATLSSKLTDAIANSWIRAGVHDVSSGLAEIRRHEQSQRLGKKNRRRRPIRREATPQWQKDQKNGKQVKRTSVAQEKAVQQMLQKMRHAGK